MELRIALVLFVFCSYTWSEKVFHFVNQLQTFAEAQRYCRDFYIDLVTLSGRADIHELFALENFTYTECAWIGLKKAGSQEYNNQTYFFINEPKSWREAQSYCRRFHTDLVSVRNQDENLQIQQLIPAGQFAYICLFKDSYVWSENSTPSFRNWDSGQPDGSGECVVQQLQNPRLWDDQKCSSCKPFFCSACV